MLLGESAEWTCRSVGMRGGSSWFCSCQAAVCEPQKMHVVMLS